MPRIGLSAAVLGLFALVACDEAATLVVPDYEAVPDGYKRAKDPLPDAVLQAMASLRLPRDTIITREGCYFTHIEPEMPELVAPLRNSDGAQICVG